MCFKRRTKSDERRTGGLLAAFTLIEVLVAMTVLSVLVLMAANIFQGSSAAWNIGTQKADMNTSARAALDYMARELACAVAGPIEAVNPSAQANLMFEVPEDGKEVVFYALSGEPDASGKRALRGMLFRYNSDTHALLSQHRTGFNPYSEALGSFPDPELLITNVWMFQAWPYASMSDLANGTPAVYPYQSNMLPVCMDLALVMLSGDDMVRIMEPSVQKDEFAARNGKVYSTRVYFPNRAGCQVR